MAKNGTGPSLLSRGGIFTVGTMAVLVLAAVISAPFFVEFDFLSLRPPATDASPNPAFDIEPDRAYRLYQTTFTAWAAQVLLIPALGFFWFRDRSLVAERFWLYLWTVSCVAFWIHLFWAIVIFFEADFDAFTNSSRVTAFWPGIIVATWWAGDVALAWSKIMDRGLAKIQRTIIHIAVAVFYFLASAVEGETPVSLLLGVALAVAFFGGLARRLMLR